MQTPAPATPSAPKEAAAPKPLPTAAQQAQAPAAPKPLEKVSLRPDWLFIGYHAPFFLAKEKGWYQEAGLDVSIGEGKGSGSTIQLVATGGDTFGYAGGGSLALLVSQGAPVVMVLNIVQKGTEAILVREESGIVTLKDLEGKSVGTSPTGPPAQLLPALFKANGVDINKVQVISVDNSVKTQAWLERKYEAMTGLINDEVVQVRLQGTKIRVFLYGDYGVAVMGHGVLVNTKTIQEKPALVKGFVEATSRGWKAALENPQEAHKSLMKLQPDAKVDETVTIEQLKANLPLTQTENSKGKPLGWMSEKDWQSTVDVLAEYAGLKEKPPVAKLFTNQFIPA